MKYFVNQSWTNDLYSKLYFREYLITANLQSILNNGINQNY